MAALSSPSPSAPLPIDRVAEVTDGTVCASPSRRRLTAQRGLYGIDTVEVEGTSLCVRFFGDVPEGLSRDNVRVEGGRRIRDLRVVDVQPRPASDPDTDSCLAVTVDREGDFSPYTIKIGDRDGDGVLRVRDGFDPRYSAATFLFHPDCPRDTDCSPAVTCAASPGIEPLLDYRAKDYASFRRLILDRWSLVMPQWNERHVPDIGIALAELLAYVGDYLSYYQDAVATEAYLETARQRISVRRHARLVDYLLHEGNNARVLVSLQADTSADLDPKSFYVATLSPDLQRSGRTVFSGAEIDDVLPDLTVFEPMGTAPIRVRAGHSEIRFYTWGDSECYLPRGTTRATLWDAAPSSPAPEPSPSVPGILPGNKKAPALNDRAPEAPEPAKPRVLELVPGDLLILEEVRGPHTGNPADADPAKRHPVRLTQVAPGYDPLLKENTVEVEWAAADALPFALCLSSRLEPMQPVEGATLMPCLPLDTVSVARGNVFLADHGRSIVDDIGTVALGKTTYHCRCDGSIADEENQPATFTPVLPRSPLTHAERAPQGDAPAALILQQRPYRAMPHILLTAMPPTGGRRGERVWEPRRDLLESAARDRHFCVETDNEGRAHLRFGDDRNGERPPANTAFVAAYRVGNGTGGNIGADALRALVFRQKRDGLASLRPRNPLPAQHGTNPEPIAAAKRFAPDVFRSKKRRAVIPTDFADFAAQDGRVQRAVSDLRWTGSWVEARTAVDPLDTGAAESGDAALLRDLAALYERVRRMGWDATPTLAQRVPLALTLVVCVRPEFVAAQVAAALRSRFSSGVTAEGTRGFFHPDNLTFGQSIAVSRIIAVAQSVPGVLSTEVTQLSRYQEPPRGEIEDGILTLAPDEVAELTNDPNHPERGLLRIETKGGR